jgi:predicted histidine transporter YuiF (NhaC family)
VGVAEILFGLLFWLLPARWQRRLCGLTIGGLLVLGLGAMFSQPAVLVAPFNPVSLNVTMMVVAAIGLLAFSAPPEEVPQASRCLRKPPDSQ